MSTVSLVTGANRGIGREVCRRLARQGHTVLLPRRSAQAAGGEGSLDLVGLAAGHFADPGAGGAGFVGGEQRGRYLELCS